MDVCSGPSVPRLTIGFKNVLQQFKLVRFLTKVREMIGGVSLSFGHPFFHLCAIKSVERITLDEGRRDFLSKKDLRKSVANGTRTRPRGASD
jgi:hypothetical protein